MTARTEVTGLAGIGQQVVMAALITVHAREPLMEVFAVEKAFEDLGPNLSICDDSTVVSDRRDA